MDEKIKALEKLINSSRNIVAFTGAGVSTESGVPDFRGTNGIFRTNGHSSTESGIPDFRSVDGLYNQKYAYPPEEILSRTFFDRRPEEFYRFYRDKMLCLTARPNAAHRKLARLEAAGRLRSIVTQNIDGLHQLAGSKRVWELHGSVHRNHCMRCGKSYPAQWVLDSTGVPKCDCGGIVKPDVVLYEEQLDSDVIQGAVNDIQKADLLIVGGTSLAVYPAAGLINYYRGSRLVLINKSETPRDGQADLVLHGPIGQILDQIEVKPL